MPVRLVAVGTTPWYGGGMTVCPGACPAACADGEPVAPLPVVAGCVPGALRIVGPGRA